MPIETYNDVRDLLGEYAREHLYLFANPWERWPVGEAAECLALTLDRRAQSLHELGARTPSQACREAAQAVRRNSGHSYATRRADA